MQSLTYIFAYHIDSTTLTDGDYELIPEQEVELSEDPGNTVGNLTEAPNRSSENFDTPAPQPHSRRQAPYITPTLFTLQSIFIYTYLCIKFLGIV
jgi:hypothetical protein